ncbi:MAG: DNA polymerase III subunit alpha [Marivivens sp.]|nr:DNA polymerase III subunit alpha [Marivivens sp.]NBT49961.1 DNA polymerase III subunit alpha [Marivivens sp.]NCW67181.1 DNA polymerase III subunit alpha [Marivivens sp.]
MNHLKLRTEYSFGQTFAPIPRIIQRLKEIGCTAAGIVDDGTWGHVAWFNACKKAGIQPLLGWECAVDDGDVPLTMWFLAKNEEGLREMYQFSSLSHHQKIQAKFRSIPRLYKGDVLEMSENIFKFAGQVTDEPFLREVGAILDISCASVVLNAKKRMMQVGFKTVEVSDNHYAYPEDKKTFEVCAKNALKTTPQHIQDLLGGQVTAAEIAEQCSELRLPVAPMISADGDIEALCRQGIKDRKMQWDDRYEERLNYEIGLIKSKNYESYFVVVADMVKFAKQHMLVGPSRGSAAGSLVCYLSGITEIDPMPPGLFFERFIDLNRTDLPDIDLDFPDNKRHLIFEYMAEKYGDKNTAHIGTVSRFKAKSALVHVCKALGVPRQATGGVKAAMIERGLADSRAANCLEDTLKETDAGKDFMRMYPEAEIATTIEGHASHTGVHAAGLLVCNDEITNYCTVDADGIAHIEKGPAEEVGLLKIDVLGLRTLTVLEDSGVPIDWYNLPLDDQKTFDVFNNKTLSCVFQFEGNAMRTLSASIKYNTIKEIDATTALARPGPFSSGVTNAYVKRQNGEPYEPIHPMVQEIMKETYGLPVYQEHTLAIVRDIGQFSWEETSFVRKAISKRQGKEFFKKFFPPFLKGATAQGINEKQANEIWELINAMGAWQMNKAHTYSYAVISYWTAYLKAHHPLEFAAANLRNAKDDDSALELLREMHKEGIEYVPFDLEKSALNWSVHEGKLLGGFTNLKGIGEKKAQKLIEKRSSGTLTEKDIEDVQNAENIFAEIFPFHNQYGHLYADPKGNKISCDKIWDICDIPEGLPHKKEIVFLAELIHKNPRNYNEEILIKKRGGKVGTGPLEFLDVRLRDDTGMIGGRIGRFDYQRIGKHMAEKTELGTKLLLRAKFFNGIRYAFITKWREI